ncbi:hypothetical protein RUM43_002348 [Polyplax serrata]|uniref:Uncharacterized protein n=1 Tax=Polyplax serrata TaxID=468196 RepID=A0AAN8PZF7_POLSC
METTSFDQKRLYTSMLSSPRWKTTLFAFPQTTTTMTATAGSSTGQKLNFCNLKKGDQCAFLFDWVTRERRQFPVFRKPLRGIYFREVPVQTFAGFQQQQGDKKLQGLDWAVVRPKGSYK